MFSQLSLLKLRLHTVTRLFWRNSAICNFTKKSDRQQSTSSIKGYTVFLSSFVSSFKEKRKRQKEGNTQPCGYQGDRLLCVACECCLFFFFLLSTRKKKRRSKRKHHTNKHSCTSPTLDFTTKVKLRLYLHCSERAYHSFFTFAPRCWQIGRNEWKWRVNLFKLFVECSLVCSGCESCEHAV